ncbi:MAG: gamma-glutamyltransferase [Campylobacteraceae bacterium]|nr:gamma-glutamyltransferase [Campylobacteraceae bacterium]
MNKEKLSGVISAGDLNTAKAGKKMLKMGGNAYDAMCACLLAAPLCEPILTSLGGGGFMLSTQEGKEPIIYDFFVDVPAKNIKNPEFFPIDVDFGTTVQEFHIGCGAAAVPGVVKGIWEIYRDLCSLPIEKIIEPAYEYATQGLYLSKVQSDFLKLLTPIYFSTKSARYIYVKDGYLVNEKQLFKNEEYGDFLKEFAKKGSDLFYKGEVANNIENLCKENDGLLNKKTLENYKIIKKIPLKFKYKDYDIYTNPPPSSGGILTAFSLLLLENENLGDYRTQKYFEKLVEAQKITGEFRQEYVDEFLHTNNLRNVLKDDKLLDAFRDEFKKKLNEWGNTTHISIIDNQGNSASTTTTNGEACGHIIPQTGIMLNNMLGEEDLNPHGFFGWESGIRLPSMMAPTALMKNGKLSLLLGSAGSNRIRSALLQTILNYTHFNMSVQEAIDEPRVHYEGGTIFTEPPLHVELDGMKNIYKLNEFKSLNLFFGGVQAVSGDFDGGADPRRGACVLKVKNTQPISI